MPQRGLRRDGARFDATGATVSGTIIRHRPAHLEPRRLVAIALTSAFTIVAGVMVALRPELLLPAAAVAGVALLLAVPALRVPFVVFVGLAVLGPPEFGPPKIAYFAGVAVAVAAALGTTLRQWSSAPQAIRQLLSLTALGLLLLMLVLVNRLVSGIDAVWAARDFAPYLLLAAAPVLAVDASIHVPGRNLVWLAGAGLAAGTLLYGLSWAARRGFIEDFGSATAFAGLTMPIALLIVASVNVGEGRRAQRIVWATLGATALAVMAASGTRSFVLAAPAVFSAVVAASGGFWARSGRLAVALVAIATPLLILAAVLPGGIAQTLLDRWLLLPAAVGDPLADLSLASRLEQTEATWRIFAANPGFGSPLGINAGLADSTADYVGDTPFTLLAGFGLVGGLAAVALLLGWLATVVDRHPASPNAWARPAMIGILVAAATYSLILPIVGDKGLGFAIILVGAPLLASLGLRREDPDAISRAPFTYGRSSDTRLLHATPASIAKRRS